MDSVLTIGEVARRSGVASSALRFYEERGLISSVRAGSGHRRYPRSVLRRIAAFADAPTFEVRGNNLTICQVCELVKDITDELPYLVAGELVKAMHGDHKLIQLFAPSRTYATGSQCLLELLRERSHGSGAGRPAA
jgi:hypothetical protein